MNKKYKTFECNAKKEEDNGIIIEEVRKNIKKIIRKFRINSDQVEIAELMTED